MDATGNMAMLHRKHVWYLVPLTAFVLAEVVNRFLLRQHMIMPLCLIYQILDPVALKTDLLRSLMLLHGQPPLLNLLTGLILKSAALIGCAPETLADVLFGICGLTTAYLLFGLVVRWTESHILGSLAVLLYFSNPSYYGGGFAGTGRNYFFYEFLLQPVLLLLCWTASLWLNRGAARAGLCLVLCAGIVTNTRTLFHPVIWGVVITAAALATRFRKQPRTVVLLGLLAVLVFFGWAGKNYLLFGTFTVSTWDGLNLDRDFASLPRPLGDIDVNKPWPDATALVADFPHLSGWPQKSLTLVTSGSKVCGGVNWNNLYMVTTRNEAVARGLAARKDLKRYIRHVVFMYKLTTRPMYLHPYNGQAFGLDPEQFT